MWLNYHMQGILKRCWGIISKLSNFQKKVELSNRNYKPTTKKINFARKVIRKYPNGSWIQDLDKLWAYVVFENPKGKTRSIAKFSYYNRRKLWEFDQERRKCRFWVLSRKSKLFLGKHKLHLRTAPDPSEIIWENLEISNKQRWWRKLIVFSIIGTILILGGILIYSIREYQGSLSQTENWRNLNEDRKLNNVNSSNFEKGKLKCRHFLV